MVIVSLVFGDATEFVLHGSHWKMSTLVIEMAGHFPIPSSRGRFNLPFIQFDAYLLLYL